MLRAGIFVATSTCPHCSRPLSGAQRCRCDGASLDPRRPHHGLAEAFLGAFPSRRGHA